MDTTPATPPFPPLARLPTEILDLIFARLDQPTLATCVRINRVWNELCTPHLWFTLNINNAERLERFLTDEAQLALSRNVRHVRELYIVYTSVCNIFAPFDTHADDGSDEHHRHLNCTNLQKLYLLLCLESEQACEEPSDDDDELKYLCPAVEKAVAAFIHRNPGLKTLELMDVMTPETLVQLLAHSLPNLETLQLSLTYVFPPCLAKILLETLPETIRSIQMTVSNTNDAEALITAEKIQENLGSLAPRRHDALESLSLEGTLHEPEDYEVFLPFLETCTGRLKTYTISGIGWARQPQVKEALTRLDVVLKSIGPNDFATGQLAEDLEIAEHLGLSAHWRKIFLRFCLKAGPLTVAAIVDNGANLQRLNLEGCGRISSKDLVLILESTPCLLSFHALDPQKRMDATGPFLAAADLATLHWATRSLVAFHCKIEVPRPMCHKLGSSFRDSLAWEQSRDLQRQVHRKLGEQKFLSHLGFGVTYYRGLSVDDAQYQRQCLEMTLESGLDELVGLKEMELLVVSNMEQHISVLELEWMDQNWPRLRRINGMFMHCVNPVPGAREWILENRRGDWAYGDEM
ncbi:hypothetical protein BG003_009551 [Podila horticola]|nr:hypothetical protein BG003_009551 [Podila horticola]